MSYDLAVWAGDRPPTDADAASTLDELYGRAAGTVEDPDPRIAAFIAELTKRYPDVTDLTDDDIDDSPWADGPLLADANGPLLYFGVVRSAVGEVLPFISTVARSHGLVCFDPQVGRLVDVVEEVPRPGSLRKLAKRLEKESWIAEGFAHRGGWFRRSVDPDVDAIVAVMTGPGRSTHLALRARIGVIHLRYEQELRSVIGKTGYAATLITDLGALVPEDDQHWYEDVDDEASIQALFERYRNDLRRVGLPWAQGFTDLRVMAERLADHNHHHLCILALVFRDLGDVDAMHALLDSYGEELRATEDEERKRDPDLLWPHRQWHALTAYLRPQ